MPLRQFDFRFAHATSGVLDNKEKPQRLFLAEQRINCSSRKAFSVRDE